MADLKVTQLSDLGAMPDTADLVMVVDVSDTTMSANGTNKKVTANYLGRSSGAVIYAQDGKALTLPASGTAATRQAANTFAAGQTINSGADGVLLAIDAVAGATTRTIDLKYNGALRAYMQFTASLSLWRLSAFDNGSGVGPLSVVYHNNNASTPAAGALGLAMSTGALRYLWADPAGLLRIHTAQPTNATDTAGSVIGDQTSALAAKTVLESLSGLDDVWERIQAGAEAVKRFVYKSGAYNNQEFEGVVIDYAPAYGKDRDEEFPAGKALNDVNILGDLLRAVTNLAARVVALEGVALDSATPEGNLSQAQREALASLGGSLLARYGA